MSDTAKLWSIFFSPWSLRVKWALAVLKFPFEAINYDLLTGEWQLRLKLWRWRVTVPVMFAKDATLTDGKDIVVYAQDHKGEGGQDVLIDGVDEWLATADEIMGMLRHNSLMNILGSEEKLAKSVPPGLGWMGPVAVMLTRNAVSGMAAKYPTPFDDAAFDAAIGRIRTAVQNSSTGYLLGAFSYADICVATAFHMVSPVPDDLLKMPAGIRASFTQPEIAGRCEDLLAWRDKIVAQHWAL